MLIGLFFALDLCAHNRLSSERDERSQCLWTRLYLRDLAALAVNFHCVLPKELRSFDLKPSLCDVQPMALPLHYHLEQTLKRDQRSTAVQQRC